MAGPAAAEERALGHGDRGWSTFALPVSGIVAGDNRIEFRYPTRPPQATWQWDGFRVKDVEIQGDPDLAPLMEAVPSIQQTSAEAAEPNVTMPSDSPRIQEADPDQDP